jgi:predicted DNA-binding transcriptional regulator YafY
MSKITNSIIMIKKLLNHRLYTIKELSEEIEVSERMIRFYKDELEKAGIYIESIRGKNGGYILYDEHLLPKLRISKYDIEALKDIIDTSDNEVLNKQLNILLKKIQYDYIDTIKLEKALPKKTDEKEMLNIISECVTNHLKVKIWYESLNKEIKERVIQPSAIFLHGKDDWVIAAFCELRAEVRLFNLNRIHKLEELKIIFK